MCDRYILELGCAHCGEMNENVYYAPSSGLISFKCEICGQVNQIMMLFEAIKEEDEIQ